MTRLIPLLLILAACSGSSSSAPIAPVGPPVNLTAFWDGTWTENGTPSRFELGLYQEAGSQSVAVTGFASGRLIPCRWLSTTGHLLGDVLTLRVELGTFSGPIVGAPTVGLLELVGQLSGPDTLAGVFSILGGPCHGEAGTWQLSR